MTSPLRYVETTHKVENQSRPFEDYDAYQCDQPLREACEREAGPAIAEIVGRYGKLTGSAEMLALGAQANKFTPELRTFDRFGHRIDEVEYHPAYHELRTRGVHASTLKPEPSHEVALEFRKRAGEQAELPRIVRCDAVSVLPRRHGVTFRRRRIATPS